MIAKIKGEEEMKNASHPLMREGMKAKASIKRTEWGWGRK